MHPTLVHMPYSPWSARARWALDHLGVRWISRPYTPIVDEPWLRARTGVWRGPVSVPVLLAERPVAGGLAIAGWAAERVRSDAARDLLPSGVGRIDAVAEAALQAGRILAGHRVLADSEALEGSCPPALRPLGPVARWVVADTWRRILKKYDPEGTPLATCEARLTEALAALDEAVGAGPFVFERFGYADITAACALAFVAPGDELVMDPRTRRAWRDPALAERFSRLVAWRDALVAARPPRAR